MSSADPATTMPLRDSASRKAFMNNRVGFSTAASVARGVEPRATWPRTVRKMVPGTRSVVMRVAWFAATVMA